MTAPPDSFVRKVVVITGGSRGLGLALGRRLAQENAKLAILARDQQELVCLRFEGNGGNDIHPRRVHFPPGSFSVSSMVGSAYEASFPALLDCKPPSYIRLL